MKTLKKKIRYLIPESREEKPTSAPILPVHRNGRTVFRMPDAPKIRLEYITPRDSVRHVAVLPTPNGFAAFEAELLKRHCGVSDVKKLEALWNN
jgi:hypothetical protein